MLQITLTQKGHARPIPAMTAEELYEAGRSAWVLGAKADKERHALLVFNDTVLQAIEIERLESAGGRRAIHGRVLEAGDPVHDAFVGRQAPLPTTRNPIKYFTHELDLGQCRCGCGERVRGDFVPGHDQRAIHERIAKIGSVADFLAWFDEVYDG